MLSVYNEERHGNRTPLEEAILHRQEIAERGFTVYRRSRSGQGTDKDVFVEMARALNE